MSDGHPANAAGDLTPEEYVQVMNLYSQYNFCADFGTPREYAECFTEHGELLLDGRLEQAGRGAIEAYKERNITFVGDGWRRHWNNGVTLHKAGPDKVAGRCYLLVLRNSEHGAPIVADCGVYEDVVVHEAGRWRFARRALTFDYRSWPARSS